MCRRAISVISSYDNMANVLSQHTRWRAWMQGIGVLIILLILLGSGASAARAQESGSEYPGGYTLTPLDPEPVRLLSLVVDANIRETEAQAFVDVQAVYRVHNRDQRTTQTLRVAFPGYEVDGPPLEQVTLAAGKREIRFGEARTQWWIAELDVKPDERLNLVLSYSAPLGDAPVLRFRYPLDLTARQWPGRLESARFTLTFDEPPNPQSWLKLTPEDYDLTAEAITWSYDMEDPGEPIDYVFLRPSLWARLREARRAAADPSATAEDFLNLGDIYAELAAMNGDDGYFDRYFPLAVAAYNQTQTANPNLAQPYLALARLYGKKAEATQPPDAAYLALATEQLAGALKHGVEDDALVEQTARNYALLIAQARLRGDFQAANQYLKEVNALAEQVPALAANPLIQEARRRLAIDWAKNVFQNEGSGPARAVLAQLFGAEAVQPAGARFARITSLHVETETTPGQRSIRIQAAPRKGQEAFVSQLFMALNRTGVGTIVEEPGPTPTLLIALTFDSADELREALAELADVTPDEPEWAMLHRLFRPQSLQWTREDQGWRVDESFIERVDLTSVTAQLDDEAAKLDRAAAAANVGDPQEALTADVWRAEAEAWRRLLDNNRARYTLTMQPDPGAPIVRIWSLEPGEAVTMSGQATRYNALPYLIGAFLAYLIVLAVILVLRGAWRRWREKRGGRV